MHSMLYHFSSHRLLQDEVFDKKILGNKGMGLLKMCQLGIPVPPGFVIPTTLSSLQQVGSLPDSFKISLQEAMHQLEKDVGLGASFGDPQNPLLVSVRSGAAVSMPGMMDTVLNVGINRTIAQGLACKSNQFGFAWDTYHRFLQTFAKAVLPPAQAHLFGIQDPFLAAAANHRALYGLEQNAQISEEGWQNLLQTLRFEHDQTPWFIPVDPWEQLWQAIQAVFASWNSERAIAYRSMHRIPHDLGTAIVIQAMVFGNMDSQSGTGVFFTRNPNSGENQLYGEFLPTAQGEDVVAGTSTPHSLETIDQTFPAMSKQLQALGKQLEQHFLDMQDVEFTIQNSKLWILQTRSGKRSGRAMVQIATDMVQEGLLTPAQALLCMEPNKLNEIFHATLDPGATKVVLCTGMPASPGAATGPIVFSAQDAEAYALQGTRAILVRLDTSPEDVQGMHAAAGILTLRGGMTSHAAVVARGMGRCCIVGATSAALDIHQQRLRIGERVFVQGDILTLDGSTGEVLLGMVPTITSSWEDWPAYQQFMNWVDKFRTLGVRANADTPKDAKKAKQLGAEGIGLCRTEHMFFEPRRLYAMLRMILAENETTRLAALQDLLPMQKSDFFSLFQSMPDLPITIRLLDPPLHEFLPKTTPEEAHAAAELGISLPKLQQKKAALYEHNPMLGFRGCRLGVLYPEIYDMQVQAILEAAHDAQCQGIGVHPEIMIPLIGTESEWEWVRNRVVSVAHSLKTKGIDVAYSIGTMIEVPRACLITNHLAQHADFFSFGTNDLTQMMLGLSRDDAGRFLPRYVELGLYRDDPFVSIDKEGVGALMREAVQKANPFPVKWGICGEHGGDPASVQFCHHLGLDYVSCSPYRVPIAKLAAAQAALQEK